MERKKDLGFGINVKPDGSLYKGYWENDQISKYGTFIEPKGNYYQGEFRGGVSEGKGVLYIKDKMKYTGEFKRTTYRTEKELKRTMKIILSMKESS